MEENQITIEFRNRFIKDCNLPIQISYSPFFEERIEQCEELYQSKTKYVELIDFISKNFEGNIKAFLDKFYEIRNNIITSILEKESYHVFNMMDLNKFRLTKQYPKKTLYADEMKGKNILDIDLKKANFQAFKFINSDIVNNAETYEDFIDGYTDMKYVKDSKYTRQVIFGKLNASRQITVERYLLERINESIIDMLKENIDLFNFGNDELMYFVKNVFIVKELEEKIEQKVKNDLNLEVKATFITIEPIKFMMGNKQILTIHKKINLTNNKFKIANCPLTYMPQVLRLLKSEEVKEHDLAFLYEKNLAYFATPLKLI